MREAKLREEAFGPATLVVRCRDVREAASGVRAVGGSLTGTVHVGEREDSNAIRIVVAALEEISGRVIVNGYPVARQEIAADGSFRNVTFDVPIDRSSWVALRIYPSSHTNPVFVLVGSQPIRASRKSAEWCLKSVDQCWSQKESKMRPEELPTARAAYDMARKAYEKILGESAAD